MEQPQDTRPKVLHQPLSLTLGTSQLHTVPSNQFWPLSQFPEKEELQKKLARLNHGDHACSFYDDARQHDVVLTSFIAEGLRRGERCLCVVDDRTIEELSIELEKVKVNAKLEQQRGTLQFIDKSKWRNPGDFEIGAMADGVRSLLNEASLSAKGLWVAVEMTWTLSPLIGVDLLGRWESFWNTLLEGMPAVLLCHYNRLRIAPAAIYLSLKTHPLVVTPDDVYRNFYYEPPDLFLNAGAHAERAEWMLQQFRQATALEEERSRRLHEQAVRIQAEKARRHITTILESITDGFMAVDTNWRFTYINRHAARVIGRLTGESREIVGNHFWDQFADMAGTVFEEQFRKAMSEQIAIHFEAIYPKLGTWFEIHAYPSAEGLAIYFQDITDRKQMEESLKQSLHEKEIMLKEIHHRVKNNLQVVASLLGLQAREIEDPDLRSLFQESQNRVRSMALIHQKLYGSENLAEIDLANYIQSLASELLAAFGLRHDKIHLSVAAQGVKFPVHSAVTCALILQELMSNSMKYAFPGDKTGKISVSLCTGSEGEVVLKVADDGVGLPHGFDVRKTTSLGLRLVTLLTDQIQGTLHVENKQGTSFTITIPRAHLDQA